MLSSHRHDEILSRLKSDARVATSDVASHLNVSEETIRRDLKELEGQGLLRRVHGGAVPPRLTQERPFLERGKLNAVKKSRIASTAARLVSDGMSIFLDTGTTTLALARRLTVMRNLTVTTNSLDIAMLLVQSSGIRVNVTPGTARPNDNALIGYETIDHVRRFFFDVAFMGIAGCTVEQGWMDYAEDESQLRRVLAAQCRRPVLLVDGSKFGRAAHVRTFNLSEIRTLVTDRKPPEPFLAAFERHQLEMLYG